MLPAAIELQKMQAEIAEKRRSARLTFYGLVMAALALTVNALVRIAEHNHWWPFD